MYEIIDVTGQVIMIPSIMHIEDSNLIDILAWQFHVDFYDASKPLEFRKNLVQMSIQWHMTKGTPALIQWVLDTYWPGGASLSEWFEYASYGEATATFTPSDVNPQMNRFNAQGHVLVENDEIFFYQGAPPAVLPQPLDEAKLYYAKTVLTNSFEISLTSGGASIDILDSGVGTNWAAKRIAGTGLPPNYPHPYWHDRYRFRVYVDENVIDPEDEVAVLALIDRYKPVSRWCEGIFRPTASDLNIGWCGMMLRFIYRESDAPDYTPEPPT